MLTPIVNLLYSDRLASMLYDVTRIQFPSACRGGKAANANEGTKKTHYECRRVLLVVDDEKCERSVSVHSSSSVGEVL